MQTSFTGRPNRDIAHAVRQTVLIKCNPMPIRNMKHEMRADGMMFSNVYTMLFHVLDGVCVPDEEGNNVD